MSMLEQINPRSYSFYLPAKILNLLDSVVINDDNSDCSYLAFQILETVSSAMEVMIQQTSGNDLITITKHANCAWEETEQDEVRNLASEIIEEYDGLILEDQIAATSFFPKTPISKKLKKHFDTVINPIIAGHGGKLKLLDVGEREELIEEKRPENDQPELDRQSKITTFFDPRIELQGQCSSCAASTLGTLRNLKLQLVKQFSIWASETQENIDLGQIIVPETKTSPEFRI